MMCVRAARAPKLNKLIEPVELSVFEDFSEIFFYNQPQYTKTMSETTTDSIRRCAQGYRTLAPA